MAKRLCPFTEEDAGSLKRANTEFDKVAPNQEEMSVIHQRTMDMLFQGSNNNNYLAEGPQGSSSSSHSQPAQSQQLQQKLREQQFEQWQQQQWQRQLLLQEHLQEQQRLQEQQQLRDQLLEQQRLQPVHQQQLQVPFFRAPAPPPVQLMPLYFPPLNTPPRAQLIGPQCPECSRSADIMGQCWFCELNLCFDCIKRCNQCGDIFCKRCRLPVYNYGEHNMFICLTCYN